MSVTSPEADTLTAIRRAAARLFYEHGYNATTLRQIAADAGLKVGSLYYHIASKESLLLDIMCGALDDLHRDVLETIAAHVGEVDRLMVAVESHIRFHAERGPEVFVGNTELRALSNAGRRVVVAKREGYEQFMLGLVEAVVAAGEADSIDPRVHLYSLFAHAAHVAGWFRGEGRIGVADLGRAYAELALRGLGITKH
ncbi:TetR/AcrR family transcriptional regulator [Sinomonas sp. ASV486]|uniref:TetR/AcrR family transcriptional regulator n=1 Tax=Sinomonas sp. ASV486 TaxID=3051170 RepID=UPI0027DC6608|nr:TetR/AcrR family transcriptional regulator [Sinomonas sp. ASV486]MDQ4490105.1 TetR/AcrR family transcriptional regulator [Sinomonas sp. ASV486]